MEETRISRMYLAIVQRWFSGMLGRIAGGGWLRSTVTWIVLAALLLVGVGVLLHERGRGRLTQLKQEMGAPKPVVEAPELEVGGQAPVVLSREQTPGGMFPEFLSATLLPGRGLNVLQITAFVPGRGVVSLLASPTVDEVARAMTGTGSDAAGQASLNGGAAIEVPWAGALTGATMPGGVGVLAHWQGQEMTLPANGTVGGQPAALGGLLLKAAASPAQPSVMPDGGELQAVFDAGDFGGHWPSKTEVTATVLLSARNVDLTVVARNTGSVAEPMGIGWRPRFAVAAAERAGTRLRLPSSTRAEMKEGAPTGRLLPVTGSGFDFSAPGGAALGGLSLDELYVHLKPATLAAGPEVELRNGAAGYGLRLTALSGSIKAMRVVAPAGGGFVEVDPQTNRDDPFGGAWPQDEEAGMVVLKPGERLEWKVRLELFSLNGGRPGPGQLSKDLSLRPEDR